jgi:hypothetical protein
VTQLDHPGKVIHLEVRATTADGEVIAYDQSSTSYFNTTGLHAVLSNLSHQLIADCRGCA